MHLPVAHDRLRVEANIPIALSIAGSDPSGGAGIQADLKTFHQFGVFGAAAITLTTVQNTRGVEAVHVLPADHVAAQITAVLSDLPVHATKTGALGNADIIRAVAAALRKHPPAYLVVDPVMISKHGASLMDESARSTFLAELLPLATLVTPNTHELTALTGMAIDDFASATRAAAELCKRGAKGVLAKGGHLTGADALDALVTPDAAHVFGAPRLDVKHTHGTGCTLSAAITACLARGKDLETSVAIAKAWLTEALASARAIGGGISPVNHFADVTQFLS